MRAWYDIAGSSIDAQQDEQGIRSSQAAIEALIAQEVARGIAPGHIFLAGFSQGGAIALHTALRQNVEAVQGTRITPIFMAHGRNDPIVPFALGIASRDALTRLGYAVEWHEYSMQHSVCEQELRDLEVWLSGRLNGHEPEKISSRFQL